MNRRKRERPTAGLERRLGALNGLRRLLRLVSGLSTVAWVAAAAAVLLGLVGMLLHPRAGIRCLLLGLSAAVVLYVLIRYVLARVLATFTIRSAAVLVEKYFGGFRNNLVSAIDVWRTSVWKRSPEFAAALAKVTDRQCEKLRFGKSVRKAPVLKAFGLGVLGVAMVAGLFFLWPVEAKRELQTYLDAPHKWWVILHRQDIKVAFDKQKQVVLRGDPSSVVVTLEMRGRGFSTLDVYVREAESTEWAIRTLDALDERGTRFEYKVDETRASYDCQARIGDMVSEIASVRVVDRPAIVKMWLEYTFPQYTELLPVVYLTRDGKVRAIYGTFVRVTIEANVELEEAMLNVNGEAMLMRINGCYASGRLRVERNGKYGIKMASTDGFKSLPNSFEIAVWRDGFPTVRVVNFQTEEVLVEIGDQGAVPVELEAKDNEGIRQVDIEYDLKQLPEAGLRKLEKSGVTGTIFYDPSRQSVRETIDGFMDELLLEIGDVVTFRVKATDTCTVDDDMPPPEPHVVFSKAYRVVIVAPPVADLSLGGMYVWVPPEPGEEGQRKPTSWLKKELARRLKRGVRKEGEGFGYHEAEHPVKKQKPGTVSTDIVPTGDSGAVRAYLGGDRGKERIKKVAPPDVGEGSK